MAAAAGTSITTATTPADAADDYVRLHITPLDRELLGIVVPAALRPRARNMSFHTIETFPEKRFGFVDLPAPEAERLKRKLNGAVLRGSKLRVQEARPQQQRSRGASPDAAVGRPDSPARGPSGDGDGGGGAKEPRQATKRQRWAPDVLPGVTLKQRAVKRGWTEAGDAQRRAKRTRSKDGAAPDAARPQEKRKRPRSKYTDRDECLLKVKLPPNALGNLMPQDARRGGGKSGGRGAKAREVTVHEFERTTHFPSFIKSAAPATSAKPAVEFVEGRGWVDEDGDVVEAARPRAPAALPRRSEKREPTVAPEESSDASTSSSGTSSDSDSDSEEEHEPAAQAPPKTQRADPESSVARDESPKAVELATPLSTIKAGRSRPPSSSSSKSLTIKIPPQAIATTTTITTRVHPLEALYKRAKPDAAAAAATPAQAAEPFSFFGNDGDAADDDEQAPPTTPRAPPPPPMTPFTRQDFEQRGMRSAAPTPDTAHPSRHRSPWAAGPSDDDDDDDDAAAAAPAAADEASPPQDNADFQAWFWNNRSELNRSWMTRRKTAAKERRHRDNRARASKAV